MNHSIIEPLEARIAPATIAISSGSFSAASGGDKTYVFHVTLTDDPGRTDPIKVDFATHDGVATASIASAHAGTDYNAVSGTLTFAPSTDSTQTTQTQNISVVVHTQSTTTPVSAFTVDLTNVTGTGVTVTNGHSTELIDDVTVHSATFQQGTSGVSTAQFPVTLAKPVPAGYQLVLTYSTVEPSTPSPTVATSSTAAATTGSAPDYTAVTNGTVTIAAGNSFGYLPVSVNGNTIYEVDANGNALHNETFGVTIVGAKLQPVSGGTVVGDVTVPGANATGTIHNDNQKIDQTLSLTAAAPTLPEGDGSAHSVNFTLHLSHPVDEAVTVTLDQTVTSTAAGSTSATTPLTEVIPAGQSTLTFQYTYNGDTTPGHDEIVTETITGSPQQTLSNGIHVTTDPAAKTATTRIQDDDATVSFTQAGTLTSTGGDLVFPISLSAAEDHDVVVTYSTVDGGAVSTGANPDFTAILNGHVTIKAGTLTPDVQPTVHVTDALAGPAESLSLHITGASGAATTDLTQGAVITVPTQVSVTGPTGTVDEGSNANFIVKLSTASEQDVTVNYTLHPDTAGTDRYTTPTMESVTIPHGSTQATVSIPITSDSAPHPQTDFTLSVDSVDSSSTSFATIDSAHGTAKANLSPANLPTVTLLGGVTFGENDSTHVHTFTVSLSKPAAADVSFIVNATSLAGDTAKGDGTDYQAVVNQTVTIPQGSTSATFDVTIFGNTVVQGDRTFHATVALANPDPTTAPVLLDAAHSSVVATIQDDEIQFGIASTADKTSQSTTVNEGALGPAHFAYFNITRSAAHPANITGVTEVVHYSTVNGTATAGQDYLALGGDITFNDAGPVIPAGSAFLTKVDANTVTLKVAILDDNTYEGPTPEQFTVQLTDVSHAFIQPTHPAGTVLITDNDPQPVIHVSSPAPIKEGNSGTTDLVFNVSLDRPNGYAGHPITVDYKVDASTDLNGVATPTSGTLTFSPNGALQQQVIVHVPGNTAQNAKPVETFHLKLSNPTGATLDASQDFGVGTVIDDDPAPVVSVSGASIPQGGQESFTVKLSNAAGSPLDVYYYTTNGAGQFGAVSGKDFAGDDAAHLQKITFPAGQTSETITIATTAPSSSGPTAGPNETFSLHLAKVVNTGLAAGQQKPSLNPAASVAVGTIVNATPEIITIGDTQVAQSISGDVLATFDVSLTAKSSVPVVVHYHTVDGTPTVTLDAATVADGDYVAKSGTLVFQPGQTAQQITVTIHGDAAHEDHENFSVQLSGATGGTIGNATATGTIVNSSNAVTLDLKPAVAATPANGSTAATFGSAVALQGGTIDYIPTLSRPAEQDVTFTVSTAALAGTANAAVPGTDFTPLSKTFTIHAGQTTPDVTATDNGHFTVQIAADDGVFEPTEQFAIKATHLTNAVAGKTTVLGTIRNQDFLISGRVAEWTDTDGDLVKLTVSKGTLSRGLFDFSTPNSIGGRTLNSFNIVNGGQQFLNTDITITATPQKNAPVGSQGDGLVNIGSIKANNGSAGLQLQGFDLGAVNIAGNLDQIQAGDLFTDAGLKFLHVHSFGTTTPAQGSFVAEGIGTFIVDGDFSGSLQVIGAQFGTIGSLYIGGALKGVASVVTTDSNGVSHVVVDNSFSGTIGLSGALGGARIGSIVGANATGSGILSAASIGNLIVLQNIDNTAVADPTAAFGTTSGVLVDGSIAKMSVGGSILGGTVRAQSAIGSLTVAHDLSSGGTAAGGASTAAVISAGGLTTHQAIGSVIVHGNVSHAKILGGYQNSGGTLSADAQINLVQVDGNATAFDVVAGAVAGSNGVFGSGDNKITNTGLADDPAVFSRIARVIIGGSYIDDGTRHGIVAQEVDAVSVHGAALRLTGAPNETVAINFGNSNDLVHEIAVP